MNVIFGNLADFHGKKKKINFFGVKMDGIFQRKSLGGEQGLRSNGKQMNA
jgi:hypothetical protein